MFLVLKIKKIIKITFLACITYYSRFTRIYVEPYSKGKCASCDRAARSAFKTLALRLTNPGCPTFNILTTTISFASCDSFGRRWFAFTDSEHSITALIVPGDNYRSVYYTCVEFITNKTPIDELLVQYGIQSSIQHDIQLDAQPNSQSEEN